MSKQIPNMKILSPNGSTKFCFLIGNQIENSISPALHTSWFTHLGIDIVYLPCQIQDEDKFKNVVSSLLKIGNFHGANITMPFKSTVLETLDIPHSKTVKATGAANTLYKNEDEKWCLENTDIYGIKKTMQSLIPQNTNYNLIVLGGGGGASSCIYYGEHLDNYCKKIFCFTRNPSKTFEKFPSLKQNKKLQILDLETKNLNDIKNLTLNRIDHHLIINTIPSQKAAKTRETNLFLQLIKSRPINQIRYFDLAYKSTLNLELAKTNGVKCVDGMLMLEEQAKESFFLWTGIRP